MGARKASKAERLGIRQRVFAQHASLDVEPTDIPTDQTIKRDVRARLIGNDYMHHAITRKGQRS